jgi:hypothetical protein
VKRRELLTGALYPLELYAVTPEQVMHYRPDGHRAEARAVSDLRPGLKDAAVGQSTVEAAPVVIVVAAVPSRLSHRYGDKAEKFPGPSRTAGWASASTPSRGGPHVWHERNPSLPGRYA